jgi:hypothetical protein
MILISLTDGRGVTSGRFSIWKVEVSLGAMLVLSSPESWSPPSEKGFLDELMHDREDREGGGGQY